MECIFKSMHRDIINHPLIIASAFCSLYLKIKNLGDVIIVTQVFDLFVYYDIINNHSAEVTLTTAIHSSHQNFMFCFTDESLMRSVDFLETAGLTDREPVGVLGAFGVWLPPTVSSLPFDPFARCVPDVEETVVGLGGLVVG